MPKYVLDSYAWIEYFLGSYKGEKVGKIVEAEENELFTPSIVVAEVTSVASREKRDAEQAYKNFGSCFSDFIRGTDLLIF